MITLKNLEQATAQEVFEQGAKHLLTQNCQSVSEHDGACAYRGENGLKCVGGCFISDDEYKPEFEGEDWISVCLLTNTNKHEVLIKRLQEIHDLCDVDVWLKELIQLGKDSALNLNFIQQFKNK
jgi:hypothetical protein